MGKGHLTHRPTKPCLFILVPTVLCSPWWCLWLLDGYSTSCKFAGLCVCVCLTAGGDKNSPVEEHHATVARERMMLHLTCASLVINLLATLRSQPFFPTIIPP